MSATNVLRGPVLPSLIAVGIVAASVVGTVTLTGKHSGSASAASAPATPPPVRNAAWVVNGAHDAPELSALTGFWIGSDIVVRGGVDGLHAMRRGDGSAAWDLPTPGGGDLCGMSAAVDDGVGIVASQGTTETRGGAGSADCSVVSGVDVTSGKVLWTTPMSSSFGDPDAGAADYAATGGTAIVDSDRDQAETGVVGLDVKTGVQKWKYGGECEHRGKGFSAAGGHVVVAEVCQGQAKIRVLDAVTGGAVAGAAVPNLGGATHPQVVSADPLVVADDGSSPKALSFGAGGPVTVTDLGGLFATLSDKGASRAQVSVGKDVLCFGGHQASCWTAGGTPTTPHGLPNEGAEHHDVYPVLGTGATARIVTTGVPGHTRASLCRVTGDGTVVVEADLSQPVSDYLGKSGTAGSYYLYADAKDLYLVDPQPSGRAAVIDVRLTAG
ncbi:hypothetical protein [Catenulispora subtropica]|uniref:Pyrrolo-quinoline quinone n=1 Tax=Catenulispora subtropica TaxID=450798 RepID=A0ABN2T4F3_9ACTN